MTRDEALTIAIEIVGAAFWDHHSAGTMPGSGYNHKVYHIVSAHLGWRDSKKFMEWKTAISGDTKGEENV